MTTRIPGFYSHKIKLAHVKAMLRAVVPIGDSHDYCRIDCSFQGLIGLVRSPDEWFLDDEVECVNRYVTSQCKRQA